MKLKDLAYYHTGGRCQALYEPRSLEDLSRIVKALHATQQKYFILGGGTNSLVMDEDYPGAVIVFTRMKRIQIEGHKLYAEAGADNSDVANAAQEAGLEGIDWMFRLPGQIGGTVRMNARCYGGEMSQVVTQVDAVMPDGAVQSFAREDKIFRGYKDTVFMNNGAIVTGCQIELKPGNKATIASRMKFFEEDRTKKGQFRYPTCGCVFKNNYQLGIPSGMLLEKAGVHKLSGARVAINPDHANFVYNKGAASREILEMTLKMREQVYQNFGVWLEYEMEILGNIPNDLASQVFEKKPESWQEDKLQALRQQFQNKK